MNSLFAPRHGPAQVFKAFTKLLRRHVSRRSHLFDPGRVLEIFCLQPDHVFASDAIAFAIGIHHPDPGLSRARLLDVLDRDRHQPALLNADHRIGPPREQEPDRAVAQVPAIGRIKRDWRRAPQLVSDVLVGDRDPDAALAQTSLHLGLDLAGQVYLGKADVAMLIALDVFQIRYFFWVEFLHKPLSQDRHSISPARCAALDYRALDNVAHFLERNDIA